MNLEILTIVSPGSPSEERVLFRIKEDVNLQFYASYLVSKIKGKGNDVFSNQVKATYWFPNTNAKRGDLIVLYTKAGRNGFRASPNTNTTHFFFWGLKEAAFSNNQYGVVLAEMTKWDVKWREDANRDFLGHNL